MFTQGNPLIGITITLCAYCASLHLSRRWRFLNPLLVTFIAILVIMFAGRIPLEEYQVGGNVISFFLGPATVALGVPLYKQFNRIKSNLLPILSGVLIGSTCGLISAGLFVWLLNGSQAVLLSMLPKSATTPISMEIVRQLGGIPELGAIFTVLTGLLGSLIGPELLHKWGIRNDVAVGVAIGTSSHGIGTHRLIQESEVQGAISSFAMGVTGIVTSLLVIPLFHWLHG